VARQLLLRRAADNLASEDAFISELAEIHDRHHALRDQQHQALRHLELQWQERRKEIIRRIFGCESVHQSLHLLKYVDSGFEHILCMLDKHRLGVSDEISLLCDTMRAHELSQNARTEVLVSAMEDKVNLLIEGFDNACATHPHMLALQSQNLELSQLVTQLSARLNAAEQQLNSLTKKIDRAAVSSEQNDGARSRPLSGICSDNASVFQQLQQQPAPRRCDRNPSRESSVDSIRKCLASSNIPGAIRYAQQVAQLDRGRSSDVNSMNILLRSTSLDDCDLTCNLPPYSPAPTYF